MKFVIDHDLHIHSFLSACSKDPEQTTELILQYAKERSLKTICLTDHFWDNAVAGASEWYAPQDFQHLAEAKPLPRVDGIRFLFGCETELNKDLVLGLSPDKYDLFDFIIIPTTHLHFPGFTLSEAEGLVVPSRAAAWVKRLDAVLNMELPFHKVGIGHLTCTHLAPTRQDRLAVINALPGPELMRLFTKAAALGVGIEINGSDMKFQEGEEDAVLRIYKIAKQCGCKFYLGSDAHRHWNFDGMHQVFEQVIDRLGLTEDDKFVLK